MLYFRYQYALMIENVLSLDEWFWIYDVNVIVCQSYIHNSSSTEYRKS